MHKSRLGVVVIDCQADDLDAANTFWSAALDLKIDETDGQYTVLDGPAGEPKVLLQKVDHPSRVHLDIETDDLEAEVARLEKLGAKRLGDIKRWVVMEAPTGHRFCVVTPQRADFPGTATEWET